MAKDTEWKKKVRKEMRQLATLVNDTIWVTVAGHDLLQPQYPAQYRKLDHKDPNLFDKLTDDEKKTIRISLAIKDVVRAEEKGDEQARQEALKPIQEYLQGRPVWLVLSAESGHDFLTFAEQDPAKPEIVEEFKGRPFYASVMVFSFGKYLEWYKEYLGQHLGVCRQCNKVYLKPKHGADSRYCSGACSQKAYRERKTKTEN